MDSPARTYLKKLIKMRKCMMRKGVSKLNVLKAGMAIKSIEPWLNAHPNATDEQVKAHISRHIGAVMCLLPGQNSPSHKTLLNELEMLFKNSASIADETNARRRVSN